MNLDHPSQKKNLNEKFCIFVLSNSDNLSLMSYLKKNAKDFKIISNKTKSRSLSEDFNNCYLMLISISLLKKKYLNLLSQTDFLQKIKILGVLYNNTLWELDKFIDYLKSNLFNLSNISIINKYLMFKKISIIKIMLVLNKHSLLK